MMMFAPAPALSASSLTACSSESSTASPARWYVAATICALADSDRHLGHAISDGAAWLAYDAVHPNASNDGFLFLGRFRAMVEARFAIENSVGVCGRWWDQQRTN
jgi:hypothetical protein